MTDRPSIAELQRLAATGYGWPNAAAIALNHAAPVLLEIAAAALAYVNAEDCGTGEASWSSERDLRTALKKVRP